MTGLQDAVQVWKNAPPASTLPQPSFASTSSARLEEGMRQMSEVVADLSKTALLDQGQQLQPNFCIYCLINPMYFYKCF